MKIDFHLIVPEKSVSFTLPKTGMNLFVFFCVFCGEKKKTLR